MEFSDRNFKITVINMFNMAGDNFNRDLEYIKRVKL